MTLLTASVLPLLNPWTTRERARNSLRRLSPQFPVQGCALRCGIILRTGPSQFALTLHGGIHVPGVSMWREKGPGVPQVSPANTALFGYEHRPEAEGQYLRARREKTGGRRQCSVQAREPGTISHARGFDLSEAQG